MQPVFDAIVLTAARLLRCDRAFIQRHDGQFFWTVAAAGQEGPLPITVFKRTPIDPDANFPSRAMLAKQTVHLPDWSAIELPEFERGIRELHGINSAIYMPLLRDGECIGLLALTRKASEPVRRRAKSRWPNPFADQALIAIENTRLFNETQEALERQTATSEILQGDRKLTLRTCSRYSTSIVETAPCGCAAARMGTGVPLRWRCHSDGGGYTASSAPGLDARCSRFSRRPATDDTIARTGHRCRTGRTSVTDITAPMTPTASAVATDDRGPAERAASVTVPMLRAGGKAIGAITIGWADPGAVRRSTLVRLLQTFADQAVIAIENARLFNETREALERQTATAEILKVIASSPSDVQPVFDAIAASANRLIGGFSTAVHRIVDDVVHLASFTPVNPQSDAALQAAFPVHRSEMAAVALVENGDTAQIADSEAADVHTRQLSRARGWRSVTFVPLMSQRALIGFIACTRREPGVIADHHVQLLRTFADQAVIAIENARLFNETQEALERQTATADILKVIASSPSDVQPVFEAIASSANRLIGGFSTAVYRVVDDIVHLMAFTPTNSEADAALKASFPIHWREVQPVTRIENGETAQIADAEAADPLTQQLSRARGWRSVTFTPLMSQGAFIGYITCTRRETGLLADHHVQLLKTFADQAVIAIENTRLFNETKEALERQTATADILKVIASSPSDVQPVFDAIASSSKQLIGGFSATVFRFVDGIVNLVAYTPVSPAADEFLKASFPRPTANLPFFELAKGGRVVQEADSEANPDAALRDVARARGFRSSLFSPLMSKGTPIGLIVVTRKEPGNFAAHHVQLLETFADQAVIAIENTRLFNETQEALERQTATADILKVIASSPSDVQPVFDAIAASANRLIGGFSATVMLFVRDALQLVAFTPTNPTADEMLQASFPRPLAEFPPFELVRDGETVQFDDTESEDVPPLNRTLARSRGYRGMVFTPLMSKGAPIGILSVTRKEPGAFASHHVQLLQTFADQAVIAIENARLFNETQEALERQTATADILKVIAGSPSDVQPVFEAIVRSAAKLFEPCAATITTVKDGKLHWNATEALLPGYDVEGTKTIYPIPFDPDRVHSARAILERRIIEVPDTDAPDVPEYTRKAAAAGGFRAITYVPLIDQDQGLGTIIFAHPQPGFKFSDKQRALVQTFADQAVIAIQNTRLFNETREALERQTATADILKVIASSPSDTTPVFEAIATSAKRLLGGLSAAVFRIVDGTVHVAAFTPINPTADAALNADFPRPVESFEGFQLAQHGKPFSIPDTEERTIGTLRGVARLHGFRSMLYVPLMNGDVPFGIITVTRVEPGGFPPHHIQLLQTFADQAVIAIENTRLFNEVQERTVELTEALEQQTATSDVLGVISSSAGDLAPVFDAMLGKAMQLCSANFGVLNTYDGKAFHTAATYGLPPAYDEYRRKQPLDYGPATAPARLLEGEPFVQFTDLLESEAYRNGEPNRRALVDIGGARCLLAVPLVKDGHVVGNVMIFRQENRPFSEKQIALLQQFAAQAVIAIENTRLLRELRESTEDLTESLQQQTATSEVLQIISSSPGDLTPVFDKMLENATRVCGAQFGSMLLVEGELVRQAALYNAPPALAAVRVNRAFRPHPQSALAAAIRTRQVCQVEDLRTQPNYLERNPATVEFVELGGVRTAAWVPMVRDDEAIGVITIYRPEVHLFDDKQIELVRNFAKQAVIAIENARLLRELRQRTDDLTESLQQQTATSEVLQIISSSPGDLTPIFDKMLENATRVCGAEFGSMVLIEGDSLRQAAFYNAPPELAAVRTNAVRPLHPLSGIAAAVRDKRVVQTEDIRNSPAYLAGAQHAVELAELGGARTLVVVPMLRDDEAIGVITVYRQEVRPFGDKQIELLTNFARQAVIAIENARLLRELRQRTDDLSKSLDDLRTAQDRLIQTEKLASLGQLTAGIAHEIKNPLNFVNNFAALSAELTDELKDVLKPAVLDETIRAEVDEVTGLLKDNLSKVVQHGKRANSIVKNMLLHSREGSGEHRPADINALVDESLNLAYHGARAEKPQFNVTLQRDFDPQAGQVEVFPQEITRVLLNLISNGFYAVTKRKADNGGCGVRAAGDGDDARGRRPCRNPHPR